MLALFELFAGLVRPPYVTLIMKSSKGVGKVLSDAQLARAAQGGDVASLGLLLERYRASLYGLALQIPGRGGEAQDAVHDTFLVALRKIDQVRDPSAVGGWLHTACATFVVRVCARARGRSYPRSYRDTPT